MAERAVLAVGGALKSKTDELREGTMADVGNGADWAAVGVTTVGLVVSVGVVLYQLGRQHKGSLKLQRSNAREALRLRVYELLGDKSRSFSDADSEAAAYARSVVRELESAAWAEQNGLPREASELRAQQLSKLHYGASSALTELILAIESWEIAFPAAELFRVAFSSANHDVEDAFGPVFQGVIRVLPIDMLDGTTVTQPLPSAEKIAELKALVDAYGEARTTLRMYAHDLVVEAQNLLLSKLFKRRVKIREPIDPSYKVITATNTESLLTYFKTETAGGRSWQEAESNVRERLRAEGRVPRQ